MNQHPFSVQETTKLFNPVIHKLCLFLLIIIPVSCTAQTKIIKNDNSLKSVTTAIRSDNKGYVIRFNLTHDLVSFDFTQPSPYLIQLELLGDNLNASNIELYDHHNIIKAINYTALKNGVGVTVKLAHHNYYQADAYPDGASNDLLVGLTKTSQPKLAAYVHPMKPFTWSSVPDTASLIQTKTIPTHPVDSTYLAIRRQMKFDTVVLDAGHGGHDTGAIGWHHTLEKNVALAITKKVGYYINKYLPNVKVVYTRDSDKFIGLKERGRIANNANGDLFVCIHANAARSSQAYGTETYFLGLERSKTALKVMERENNVITANGPPEKISKQQLMVYELANSGNIANSQILAGMIQKEFKNHAHRRSRGVKQARFVVLYHASMPAVLVETGFITNPAECKFLTSKHGQALIASAIFRAIRSYKQMVDKSMNYNVHDNQ